MQLEKIDRSIDRALSDSETINKQILEKQKSLVHDLAGRCHQLEVQRDIISFAEAAEELANSSPNRPQEEVAADANQLKNRIEHFLLSHRPSKTNSKFLRFAHACIAKAERHEPVLVRGKDGHLKKVISIDSFQSKEVTLEMFDCAEELYALASFLYHEDIDNFRKQLEKVLPEDMRKELIFHLSVTNGDLELLDQRDQQLLVIQALLGYAHTLTDYYVYTSPYPPIAEIHRIFKDLDLLGHFEEEQAPV